MLELPSGTLAVEENEDYNLRGGANHGEDSNKIKVLVKFKSEQGKEDTKKMKASKVKYESQLFNVIAMEIDPAELVSLQNDPDIERVDLDQEVYAILPVEHQDASVEAQQGKPGKKKLEKEPQESKQTPDKRRELAEQVPWGIRAVQADQVTPGPFASEIKVCVVDTGYDPDHPDLPGRDAVTGNDSVEFENSNKHSGLEWDVDGHGHGTHVAGTIAALGNNNNGVIGVIPDANPHGITLHIGKGLDDSGSGSVSGIIEAVERCIDAGSDIFSMSLGGGGFVQTFHDTLLEAYVDYNILIVAAAGNSGTPSLSYPASYASVMSVGAVKDADDEIPYYRIASSQHNPRVEIAAPGVGVLSTLPGNKYASWSGTSMATPHGTSFY